MDFLNQLFENTQIPLLSSVILGLMTAVSPCPLATNITAVGFISKDIENKKRVFLNGIIYTLGRSFSYVGIGIILLFGADQIKLSMNIQVYGEKIIGPLLVLIGIFMLGIIKISLSRGSFTGLAERYYRNSYTGVFLLGVVFALAFCPYSGVLYFGMLIPMAIGSSQGIFMLFLYALATGIPVIIFAWLLAYAVNRVGNLYNRIKSFEKHFRKVVAILFIVVGVFYIIKIYFPSI